MNSSLMRYIGYVLDRKGHRTSVISLDIPYSRNLHGANNPV